MGERLSGKRFTGEWKYDGERAQIHVLSRDSIQVDRFQIFQPCVAEDVLDSIEVV